VRTSHPGDDLNLYEYTSNDPLNKTDPAGNNCTGSRLTNNDSTCESTGGFTTDTDGLAQCAAIGQLVSKVKEALKDLEPAGKTPFESTPGAPVDQLKRAAANAIHDVDKASASVGVKLPNWLRGIYIHLRFDAYEAALGPSYDYEVSYRNGEPVKYGWLGSVRADAIFGSELHPEFASSSRRATHV
jgi:hypothetical protein